MAVFALVLGLSQALPMRMAMHMVIMTGEWRLSEAVPTLAG